MQVRRVRYSGNIHSFKITTSPGTSVAFDVNLGSNKRAHGRELSERAQKKRMKYDPTLNTVIDIQEALIQQEEREKELKQKGKTMLSLVKSHWATLVSSCVNVICSRYDKKWYESLKFA